MGVFNGYYYINTSEQYKEIFQEFEKQQISKGERREKNSQYTIMVVDDEKLNRFVLVEFIKDLGYNYLEAKNGEEALKYYEQVGDIIDLILLDVGMPDISGLEVAKTIRQCEIVNKKDLYIVGQTAFMELEIRETDFFASGMDAIMSKPISKELLERFLELFLV